MELEQKPTDYSRWNRNRPGDFLRTKNLPVVIEDGDRLESRKQHLRSVRRYVNELKNVRSKSKQNQLNLIEKYSVNKVQCRRHRQKRQLYEERLFSID